MKKFSFLYIFAFFDGLGVASGALIGFFFPQIVSDIFGANFQTNDLVWFKFVLLPGFAINVLYMFFAISKNKPAILLSNILRILTTIGFVIMWREAVVLRSLLNLMIIHHIAFISATFVLYFKKDGTKELKYQVKKNFCKKTSLFLFKT
jgi:hypothetical protein